MVITYLVTITGDTGGGITGQCAGHNQGESLLHMPGGRRGVRLYLLLLIIGDIFPH